MYEILLLSVVVACGYWGQFFLRRKPHGSSTFGQMQLGAAVLALGGIWARHGGPEALGVVGAIGLGMGTVLLVIGPMVRGAARRMAGVDRLGIAKRLFDIAELLNPGSGVAEEKALLGAMKEIREGKVEQTIEALAQARDRAPNDAKRAIDERIAMLYLAAYRWEDAIAHAEGHLFDAPPLPKPEGEPSLRDALGIAPPVWVELLGAYGRIGDLDRAAQMLAALETACEGRADAGVWIHRARMMFLALAGRPNAVRALVAPGRAKHMSVAARSYWVAVAHEHHGDREAATAAYAKARSKSRGKPREMIDKAVAQLDQVKPTKLSDSASEAVAKAEAAPIPDTPQIDRPAPVWAAPVLVGATLAVAAAIAIFLGGSGDIGTLVRAGAIVRGFVEAGEWWRIVAGVFIHIGAIHLVVNALGLYFIGRLAEEMYGGSRVVALFAISGISGATMSFLASPAGVSAGASGAIFGLLGAVFVELGIHRKHYRAAWKRGMFGSLAIVTIAQVGIDFMYPIVDQWAHGGGLISGALFGMLLSPRVKWARFSLYATRSIAIVFAMAAIYAGVMIARTTLADSFASAPRVRRVIGDMAISVPAAWTNTASGVQEPDALIVVDLARVTSDPTAIATWIATTPVEAKKVGNDLDNVIPNEQRKIALPSGWEGSELAVSFVDAMEYRQHFRIVVAGKSFGETTILVRITVPDYVSLDAPDYLAQTIATISPAN